MTQDIHITPDVYYSPSFGSIMLDVEYTKLPHHLTYANATFTAKDEFHVTVINARRIAGQFLSGTEAAERRIVVAVEQLLHKRPLRFKHFSHTFYYCQKEQKQSIITLAEVDGLQELYEGLRHALDLKTLPDPTPHVTLFVRGNSYGIAVPNQEVLMQLCHPVTDDAAQELHALLT